MKQESGYEFNKIRHFNWTVNQTKKQKSKNNQLEKRKKQWAKTKCQPFSYSAPNRGRSSVHTPASNIKYKSGLTIF